MFLSHQRRCRFILYCADCGDPIPEDTLCYLVAGRYYCPRCILDAATFADPGDPFADRYFPRLRHFHVTATRQCGRFLEKTVSFAPIRQPLSGKPPKNL